LGNLTEYATAASLHCKNRFLGLGSEHTTAANAGSYQTKIKLTLRQPGAHNQPSSFGSMSSLGIFECSVLNNFISGTSFDHKISTAVSFGPAQCVPSSISSASHKGNMLHLESSHPKPSISWKKRFENLAVGKDRETRETGHLAITGAFPETHRRAIPGAFPETSPPTPFVPLRRKFDGFAAGENLDTQENRRLAIPEI
jgi:hypothetical protein